MGIVNRFVAGAALGSILTVAFGALVASLGIGSINGIVIAVFVGIVAGSSSVIGGAL